MDEDMRGYMEGKLFGSWACARHAAPHLARGGSITSLNGGTGARPKCGFAGVTPVLAAVEALSGALALEMAPVRVNTIRPGFVDTDMLSFRLRRNGTRSGRGCTTPSRPGVSARLPI